MITSEMVLSRNRSLRNWSFHEIGYFAKLATSKSITSKRATSKACLLDETQIWLKNEDFYRNENFYRYLKYAIFLATYADDFWVRDKGN